MYKHCVFSKSCILHPYCDTHFVMFNHYLYCSVGYPACWKVAMCIGKKKKQHSHLKFTIGGRRHFRLEGYMTSSMQHLRGLVICTSETKLDSRATRRNLRIVRPSVVKSPIIHVHSVWQNFGSSYF